MKHQLKDNNKMWHDMTELFIFVKKYFSSFISVFKHLAERCYFFSTFISFFFLVYASLYLCLPFCASLLSYSLLPLACTRIFLFPLFFIISFKFFFSLWVFGFETALCHFKCPNRIRFFFSSSYCKKKFVVVCWCVLLCVLVCLYMVKSLEKSICVLGVHLR